MGMGWPGGSGGGGTGNLNGDLTADFIPIASGAHTLVDSALFDNSGSEIEIRQRAVRQFKDGPGPNIYEMQAAGNGSYAQFYGTAAEGDIATPTELPNGNTILSLDGAAYNGSNYIHTGWLQLVRDGAAGMPGKWQMYTRDEDGAENLGFVQNPEGTLESTKGFTAQAAATVEGALTANDTAEFNGETTLNENTVINKTTTNRFETLAIVTGDVEVDASLSDWFDLHLTENAELSSPINSAEGRKFMVRVRNNGAFTLTFGATFRFSGGVAPVVTPGANFTSYLYFVYNEITTLWDCLGEKLNFE